ncbi:MAG: YDG domain-containing protein, partial [Rhodanobacter sp.]
MLGETNGGTQLNRSYAYGNISGTGSAVGGLVGKNGFAFAISDSYATGDVIGVSDVGGLVGSNGNEGIVRTSYSTGAASGSSDIGGLVGSNFGVVDHSFWDVTTSGLSASAGGTGMTSIEMMLQSNFTSATNANGSVDPGWDFVSIWAMYDGHSTPLVRTLLTPLTVTVSDVVKTYDGTIHDGTSVVTYSDAYDGNLLGTVTYGGSAQGAVDAGSYSIAAGGLYSNQHGYLISYVDGSLAINPYMVDLSGSRSYDGTTIAAAETFTLGVLVGGETLSLSGTGAVANKDVGTGKVVSLGTLALGDGTGRAGNYILANFLDTTFVAADFSYVNLPNGYTGTFSIFRDSVRFTVVAPDLDATVTLSNL